MQERNPSANELNTMPAEPVTLRELLLDARDELLQWERGLPGTLRWLLQRPALVVRSFVWQRSPRFVRPLRFLLLSVAVFVLTDWFIHQQLGLKVVDGKRDAFADFLLEHIAVLQVLLLPLMALLMRLLFQGLQLRYVDALVTLGYSQAMVNLASALLLLLLVWWPANVLLQAGHTVLVVIYVLWAWASTGIGPAWRRWLAAVATLLLAQTLNAAFLALLARWF